MEALDSLQITTGEKRIPIVRDGVHVGELVFNPKDSIFAEKLYVLLSEFQEKLKSRMVRMKEIESIQGTDSNGVALNAVELTKLTTGTCVYIRSEIDKLFGNGTSQMVFGDSMVLESFQQFFSGVLPHIEKERKEKVDGYIKPKFEKSPKRNRKNNK